MIFRRGLHVGLEPLLATDIIPFARILARFMKAGFDPGPCEAAVREEIRAMPALAGLLDPQAIESGGFVARPEAIRPRLKGWLLQLREGAEGHTYRLPADEDLSGIGELIRAGVQSDDPAAFAEMAEELGEEVVAFLVRPGAAPSYWPRAERPGIYRREHASLLVRSETTSVLIDPIGMQVALPRIVESPLHPPGEADLVLITHSHADHFDLPSLLGVTREDTRVVVPEVPVTSVLTRVGFEESARTFGLHASSAAWGSRVTAGDVTVEVLPFYGEQPARDPPGPPEGVRSWGSCYRIETPLFSALVLVDSGRDPLGDMEDVVRAIAPCDVVLSCLRSFASPFFGGLEHYWMALPFARLRELHAQHLAGTLPFTTAGPEGTARLCAAARARWFLPYAHGFEGAGVPIRDVGWGAGEPSEAEALDALGRGLAKEGAATRAIAWSPGDAAVLEGGELRINRCGG